MLLRQLFDRESSTYTYLLADESTREALLIDPVLEQIERDLSLLGELGLTLRLVLDTHVHADHVTAAGALRARTSAETIQGASGAACASRHVRHGDRIALGSLVIECLATPGHTDDSMSYHVAGELFTGDALLVRGTGRTDFQNGDAGQLYDSITSVLFALPDATRVWPAHDYRGHTGSTIGEERRHNPRIAGKSREQFIAIMGALALPPPAQLERAVPLNRACGVGTLNQAEPVRSVRDIEPDELARLPASVRVVDVREPAEWTGELPALERAERVPLGQLESAQVRWNKRDPVVLVCRSGRRSADGAARLVAAGFENVMNLRGGMLAVPPSRTIAP